jgi:hypothetical protein
MDSMLGVVGGYAVFSNNWNCPDVIDPPDLAVWDNVDCLIETLVGGIFSPFTLTGGVIGFLVSCLLSNAAGIFIALMGGYLIMQLLFAIARSLYIFISAYIAVSIMVMLSPIFVPLILFRATFSYFEKWLKMTISFMLQPVILFAYLAMLIIAVDYVVFTGPLSLYRAIITEDNWTGTTVDSADFNVATWDGGVGGLGGWLLSSGVYGEQSQGANAVSVDIGKVWNDPNLARPESLQSGVLGQIGEQAVQDADAWKADIFNYLGIGSANDLKYFKVDFPTTAIDWQWMAMINDFDDELDDCDWGPPICTDPTNYIVGVFIAMMMALITGYIFMTMLDHMPYISSGLAGRPVGISPFGTGRMAPPGSKAMDSAKSKMMLLAGMGK